MSFIPAGAVSDLKRFVNDSLPETALIARTGLSLACRVNDDRTDTTLDGFPKGFRIRRWRITFQDGQDVQAGDRIAVSGRGNYTVWEMRNPNTYSVATACTGLRLEDVGTPLPASVITGRGVPIPGQTKENSDILLENVTVRQILGMTMHPVDPLPGADAFGSGVVNFAEVWCDWPAGCDADMPISPQARLLIENAGADETPRQYKIDGVRPYPGLYVVLRIQVPRP